MGEGVVREFGVDMYTLAFSCGSAAKESACSVGDLGLIPGLGRSLAKGNSNPFHYSCPENARQRNLVGYSLWDCKKSDMTEQLT